MTEFPQLPNATERRAEFKLAVTDIVKETRRQYDLFLQGDEKDSILSREHWSWQPPRKKDKMEANLLEIYHSNAGASRPVQLSSKNLSINRVLQPAVCAVGNFPGTLNDVIYCLHQPLASDTSDLATYFKKDWRPSLLGNSVLHTFKVTPTMFHGLKYKLEKTSVNTNGEEVTSSLAVDSVRLTETVYIEYVGIYIDSRGERFGFHVMESVDLPEVVPAPIVTTTNTQTGYTSGNVIRSMVSVGCLFKDSIEKPGYVDVFALGAYDVGRGANHISGRSACTDAFVRIPLTTQWAETILWTRHALPQRSLKEPSKTDNCHICRGKSSLLNRHGVCAWCNQTVCKKCSIKRGILGPQTGLLPCCTKCVHALKRTSPFPDIESSRVMLDSRREDKNTNSNTPKLNDIDRIGDVRSVKSDKSEHSYTRDLQESSYSKELRDRFNSSNYSTSSSSCLGNQNSMFGGSLGGSITSDASDHSLSSNHAMFCLSDADEHYPCPPQAMPRVIESHESYRAPGPVGYSIQTTQTIPSINTLGRHKPSAKGNPRELMVQMMELQVAADRAFHTVHQNGQMLQRRNQ